MLDKRKIMTLCLALAIFAVGAFFIIGYKSGIAAAIVACDVCAAVIYVNHAIIKRRPV